jgi:hypothetical protein
MPSVTLGVPAEAFIGDTVNFTVTFDNDPKSPPTATTGYGPFVDVIFPNNGADGQGNTSLPLDGLSFVNATYLGIGLTSIERTFPNGGGHPLTSRCLPVWTASSGASRTVTATSPR